MIKRLILVIFLLLMFVSCQNTTTTSTSSSTSTTTTITTTSSSSSLPTTTTALIDVSYLNYVAVSGTIRILGFKTGQSREHVVIPETINELPVTQIASNAFKNNPTLKTIQLPSALNYIGDEAFAFTPNLTSVRVNGMSSIRYVGNRAFSECKKLTSVQLHTAPDLLTFSRQNHPTQLAEEDETIVFGELVFYKCNNLTTFTVPDGTLRISQGMFTDCELIEVIILPAGLRYIEDYAFAGCRNLLTIVLPDSLLRIGNYGFMGCERLENVVLPNQLQEIGNLAFRGCISLNQIVIPISVLKIGDDVFVAEMNGVYPLRVYVEATSQPNLWSEIFAPSYTGVFYDSASIQTINDYMVQPYLNGWSILGYLGVETELTIPNLIDSLPVLDIHSHAFSFQNQIKKITIPSSVLTIGDSAFYRSLLEEIVFEANSKVEHLGAHVFEEARLLKTPTLPVSIRSIGAYAFYMCDGLTGELILPPFVQIMESYTFGNVPNLTKITLPPALTTIQTHAFIGVDSLEWMKIPASVTTVHMEAIADGPKLIILLEHSFVGGGWNRDWNPQQRPVYMDAQSIIEETQMLYQIKNNQAILIKQVGPFTNNVVTIPENVQGYPVSIIGQSAFQNRSDITQVGIPSSVVVIRSDAFVNCTQLEQVIFHSPSKLTTIEANAFMNTEKLHTIILPDSIKYIKDYAFFGAISLHTFTISNASQLTEIGSFAFQKTPKLKEIYLPIGVNKIGYWAFGGNLTTLDNDFEVSLNIWIAAKSKAALWDEEWVEYEAKPLALLWDCHELLQNDDYLYRIDEYNLITLVRYIGPQIQEVLEIPSQIDGRFVAHLGSRVFAGMKGISRFIIPETIQTIGEGVFLHCRGIQNLLIPAGIQYVGKQAFDESIQLQFILFQCPSSRSLQFEEGWQGYFGTPQFNYQIVSTQGIRIPQVWMNETTSTDTNVLPNIQWNDPNLIGVVETFQFYGPNGLIYESNQIPVEIANLEAFQLYLMKVSIHYTIASVEYIKDFYHTIQTTSIPRPVVELLNLESSSTTIDISVHVIDTNQTFVSSQFCLYDQDALVVCQYGLSASFTGLYSNRSYLIVYYLTSLVGREDITQVNEFDWIISTKELSVPSVEIIDFNPKARSIRLIIEIEGFDASIVDWIRIEKNGIIVQEIAPSYQFIFENLEPFTEYVIRFQYHYDLHDGHGIRTNEYSLDVYTLAEVQIHDDFVLIYQEPFSSGDLIQFSFSITNPYHIEIRSVYLNGIYVFAYHDLLTNVITGEVALETTLVGEIVVSIDSLGYFYNPHYANIDVSGQLVSSIFVVVPPNIESMTALNGEDYVGLDGVRELLIHGATPWTTDLNQIQMKFSINFDGVWNTIAFEKTEMVIIDEYAVQIPWKFGDSIAVSGGITFVITQISYDSNLPTYTESEIIQSYLYIYQMQSHVKRHVSSPSELQDMEDNYYYELTNDIDLSLTDWIPKDFIGYLNGNHYSIRNFAIFWNQDPLSTSSVGLFERLFGGKIVNLNIVDASITIDSTTAVRVGLLAGWVESTQLINVNVSGTVRITSTSTNSSYVGGIAGRFRGSSLMDSSFDGELKGMYSNGSMGGLVGDWRFNPFAVSIIKYNHTKGTIYAPTVLRVKPFVSGLSYPIVDGTNTTEIEIIFDTSS